MSINRQVFIHEEKIEAYILLLQSCLFEVLKLKLFLKLLIQLLESQNWLAEDWRE